MQLISQFELKKLIEGKRDFKLVETLPPDKYQHAHLPGAINIPPDKVRELAPGLLPQKAEEIVVYCAAAT
jgi:rhodanese-related sulfurtransferase